MKRKNLKAGYIIISLLLTGLISTAYAAITCPGTLPQGTVGRPYLYTFTGTNGNQTPGWYCLFCWYPNGLSLHNNYINSVDLSGSLAGNSQGTYNLSIRHYEAGIDPTCAYTLVINRAIRLTLTSGTFSTNATQYQSYTTSAVLTADRGTTPYSWTATNLPPGLNLSSTSGTSITITGIPQVSGPFSFTVTVTDVNGSQASATYSLTVNSARGCHTGGNGVIDFGTLNAVANAGGVAASEALVTTKPVIYCTAAGNTYAVTAAGANGGTNMGTGYRLLHGTSDYIAYNIIYTTPITGKGDTISIGGSGTGNLALTPSIPAGALNDAPAGTYSDTITLTISY
ncbi:MAG: hypothetical protein CVU62_06665 [Deltaproteobacteria bacterium HGW-Deltaproteobacteria-2]|jgi:hypothetical protein|nr:MAG: hypothetical protein CVU62_06665 [Deltaproteobacteria bacterium HGW-Deltaproteobacteria-2]